MARTINEIQTVIEGNLRDKGLTLSSSSVAEWRLWSFVVAAAINVFEHILDIFRKEVDDLTDRVTPGTLRWYAAQVMRFQTGHKLEYDSQTAMLYYPVDDPAARVIKVVAIIETPNHLTVKVATQTDDGEIKPILEQDRYNFVSYMDAIKFAGISVDVVSQNADRLRYDMIVYHDAAYPPSVVKESVEAALDAYKTDIGFDGIIYRQRLIDAVMAAEGVITVDVRSISRAGAADGDQFSEIGVADALDAGYFDYDVSGSRIEMKTVNSIEL